MTDARLYPPSPANVPADMTRASGQYRLRVSLLLASLVAFVLLYLALLAGAAWFTYWAFTYDFGSGTGSRRGQSTSNNNAYRTYRNPNGTVTTYNANPYANNGYNANSSGSGRNSSYNPLLNIGLGLAGAMLTLFLLKGLFKGQRSDRGHMLQVTERDQPELFAFIRRLCQEVRAPLPGRVYLTPDVNAAVIYDTTLLSLVVPPRKDLVIGLGVVNTITLSEFKAVLAHEFGHFSQRSLRLGTYVYVARRVLSDVVYARDSWDEWLRWWRRWDIRLSFPAWGLTGVVWVLRKTLGGIFRGITLIDLSLSRQMEFNADDVAVSAAGSDAIVHVLCRLEFASEALGAAGHDLHTAADHGLFTRDLFHHQTTAAERLRRERKDPRLGLPPAEPAEPGAEPTRVFDPAKGDEGIPPMWRSHPANHEREANAKRHYLRVALDDRPPWLLFNDVERVKEDVSRRFYKYALERKEPYQPAEPAAVQAFIDAEHAESTFDPKYCGLYDDRFLCPGDVAAMTQGGDTSPHGGRLAAFLKGWPGADLEQRMEKFRRLQAEHRLLSGLHSGEYSLKGKMFKFRDADRTMRDVPKLFETVDKELSADGAELEALDREVFTAHYAAARAIDAAEDPPGGRSTELLERYRFHLAVQNLLRQLLADENRVSDLLKFLSGKTELEPAQFQQVVGALREVAQSLDECVRSAERLPSPALTNVPAGTPLRKLIWETGADIPRMTGDPNRIQSDWIMDYLRKQGAAQGRLRRIHYKSLGNILALQERIATAWRARSAGLEPAATAEPAAEPAPTAGPTEG